MRYAVIGAGVNPAFTDADAFGSLCFLDEGLVVRGGLANHYVRTKALFDTYATSSYAPPRQAIAAFNRSQGNIGKSR